MSKLIPITIFSIVMAMLSHRFSEYDYINYKYVRKDRFFYTIMSIALILFCGLRTFYNDTYTYIMIYEAIPEGVDLFEGLDWTKAGENPGFHFSLRILRNLGFSTQSYLLLFSFIIVGIHLWFIREYSCDISLSIVLFITFAGYIFTLAAIKQCMATALCLAATHFCIKKKPVLFVTFVLVAMTFHPYALMYLVVPALKFRPWSGRTFIMLTLALLAGVFLQTFMGTLVNMTDMLGENYDASTFTGEGINPMRLAVTSVPVVVSLAAASQIRENEDEAQYVILNLTMLNAAIMVIALFGTANYFGRLANYFLPFQAVAIPWLITHFNPSSKRAMTVITTFCFGLYYIYSQSIHESFDANFYGITLWQYIESLVTGG